MNNNIEFKKELRIIGGEKILKIIKTFSATEKAFFIFFVAIIILSSISLAYKANLLFTVETPTNGGYLDEGMIGLPRSMNPVLAFTDIDRDITTLIYSGLMKYENGKLVLDMAEKYNISDDKLTYTFTLKNGIKFHDGIELTTDDIEFTIQKIQDGMIKSPKKADWSGVIVKKINNKEIQFILKQPYSPFISNTTIGILPKHIWKNLDSDQFIFSKFNLDPIGSGPYKVEKIINDKNGIPITYSLSSFNKFHNSKPYISEINLKFYSNERLALEAFNSGEIESFAGFSIKETANIASTTKNIAVIHNPSPRIFGIFFNQNSSPVLANKEVRQALNMVIDKDQIIKDVLYGYGVSIDGPLPDSIKSEKYSTTTFDSAVNLLKNSGWQKNKDGVLEKKSDKKSGGQIQTLEFSISTTDSEDLKKVAEIVKESWEKLGAKVNVKVFEYGDLSQNIIKTRKYDALLFGEIVSKNLDLYAFWHSSQKNYPGLNVAMYVNSKADKILEDTRVESDEKNKDSLFTAFEKIIKDDVPAVFLYSPEYTYILPDKIKGYENTHMSNPSDRFYGIEKWYIETDYINKMFKNKNN